MKKKEKKNIHTPTHNPRTHKKKTVFSEFQKRMCRLFYLCSAWKNFKGLRSEKENKKGRKNVLWGKKCGSMTEKNGEGERREPVCFWFTFCFFSGSPKKNTNRKKK